MKKLGLSLKLLAMLLEKILAYNTTDVLVSAMHTVDAKMSLPH